MGYMLRPSATKLGDVATTCNIMTKLEDLFWRREAAATRTSDCCGAEVTTEIEVISLAFILSCFRGFCNIEIIVGILLDLIKEIYS